MRRKVDTHFLYAALKAFGVLLLPNKQKRDSCTLRAVKCTKFVAVGENSSSLLCLLALQDLLV